MSWRIAESLKKLREEINAEFPNRSKASDGAIGDEAHASRSSDHNPWVKDGAMGIVTAIDVTHDPKSGCTGDKLAAAMLESRDPRIKYIIWNRRIAASYPTGGKKAWEWRPYSGVNAHQHHLHISVSDKKNLYDSRDDWGLNFDLAQVRPLERVTGVNDTQQTEPDTSPASLPSPAEESAPTQQADAGSAAAQVNVTTAPDTQAVPLTDPNAPPIQASQNSGKSLWTTISTGIAAVPAAIWGLIQGSSEVTKWALIVIGGIVGLLIIRWIVTDSIRMIAASSQTRNNVR